MDPRLIGALELRDVDGVCAFCEDEDDRPRVLAMYNGAVMHAYNAMQDLELVVSLGERAFAYARACGDDVIVLAKPIAYNVGSFTWSGWDDGPAIEHRHLAAGHAAAELNLEVAQRLDRGIGNARWLVGAHQLAAGRRSDAAASFRAAVDAAEDRASELLFGGYVAIAEGEPMRDLLRDELSGLEDGRFYLDQLDTAARVFA